MAISQVFVHDRNGQSFAFDANNVIVEQDGSITVGKKIHPATGGASFVTLARFAEGHWGAYIYK